jgi:hypothetical protein
MTTDFYYFAIIEDEFRASLSDKKERRRDWWVVSEYVPSCLPL